MNFLKVNQLYIFGVNLTWHIIFKNYFYLVFSLI